MCILHGGLGMSVSAGCAGHWPLRSHGWNPSPRQARSMAGVLRKDTWSQGGEEARARTEPETSLTDSLHPECTHAALWEALCCQAGGALAMGVQRLASNGGSNT